MQIRFSQIISPRSSFLSLKPRKGGEGRKSEALF